MDDEVMITKESAFNAYPHLRCDCPLNSFTTTSHTMSCEKCWCYVCDLKVSACKQWSMHCNANPNDKKQAQYWKNMRALSKAQHNPSSSSSARFTPPVNNGIKSTPVIVDLTRDDGLYQQNTSSLPVLRIPTHPLHPPSKRAAQSLSRAAEVLSRIPTVSKITKSATKKRSPSPYICFCKENRERIKAKNIGASFGEIGRALGLEWSMISAEEKAVISLMNIRLILLTLLVFSNYYCISTLVY